MNVREDDLTTFDGRDDVYTVGHVCLQCGRRFWAKPDAFLDKGLCAPCYETRATSLLDFLTRCRCKSVH